MLSARALCVLLLCAVAMFAIWVFFEALTGAGIYLFMRSAHRAERDTRDIEPRQPCALVSPHTLLLLCVVFAAAFMWMSSRRS